MIEQTKVGLIVVGMAIIATTISYFYSRYSKDGN